MKYEEFIDRKTQLGQNAGFEPTWMPDFLFGFQKEMVRWSILKGRGALFEDCGMGKTPQELVWAQNVVEHTNKPVLVLTPLAVSFQTVQEAEKFGIEATRSDGEVKPGINITNYERLHHFNPHDFAGVVCDESSILKNFDGKYKKEITEFMRKLPYRLLGSATAAPNDYIELGTSSEALGELGYMDMLTRFFKNDQNTIRPMVYRHQGQNFAKLDDNAKWRFKGHAEQAFWKWVCSWARALRKPSDLGFSDDDFKLPPLIERDYLVESRTLADGMLFSLPAVGLAEQRDERRRTIDERCEMVAELVSKEPEASLVWCHLNEEGNKLERMINGAVQVSGKDSDKAKEEKFVAFQSGQLKKLIIKPKIGAWGLNWQHCGHVTTFPSHSFEQYYQSIRRCWRYGRKGPVRVDIVTTEGEKSVLQNLQRKAKAADKMFADLVRYMGEASAVDRSIKFTKQQEVPAWL